MRAADALASATTTYAVPLLVLVTTGSTVLTGLAFLIEWVPRIAAFTVAGSLVDRWGAGHAFRVSNTARTLVVAVTAVVLLILPSTGGFSTAATLVFGAVSGLLAEVSFVAIETLGAKASRDMGSQAHRVQAAQTGIDQAALLIGPLLGGLLLLAGPTALLVVVALLALTATTLTPPTKAHTHPTDDARERSSLRTGWTTLRHTPALVWLVGGLAASNLATGVLQASAPITVVHHFHYSTAAVGSVWSAAAVASLVAIWISRRAIDRFGIWAVGASMAALVTLACLGAALAPTFPAYTIAVAAVMAGEGAMTVVLRTLRAHAIPAPAFGSTLAVTIILVLLPLPLAGALIALVPADSIPLLLLACAILQGAALAVCFAGLRRHRSAYDLPGHRARASASESEHVADAR
ncbi:MFS transporter [Streptomyces sp. SID11385]|nr:MFS transporter [Streptomyces sp. SID11385]NEA37708.1 MFS transporter [Streptomyces sp. SID11385]NEA43530.1 MFS transporter [Streptomyces sp. SID11385]